MRRGVDSLTPPTAAQARAAARSGISWWGGYLGGSALAGAPWPHSAWDALKAAGIKPLGIWAPDISGDPTVEAHKAMAAAAKAGVGHEVALDTEAYDTSNPNLKRFVDGWNRTLTQAGWTSVVYDGGRVGGVNYHGRGIEWLPAWNGSATASSGSAHQYHGGTTMWGIGVDLDVAGNSFPFGRGSSPPPQTVEVSAPQLLTLAEDLVDCRYRTVSVRRQAMGLHADLHGVPAGAAGDAAGDVKQAVGLLAMLTGGGVDGLSHVRGELFQLEMFVRRVRDEALRADASKPKGKTGTGTGTTTLV